ncbi:DUF928 domain-containing protein [Leptothoe spongobia]|uniref:DUF928 domain-containing protein n=1 Tax=Leptothoe spongobia TAU-MAC 1115 TaxID=1967444 RepID=A0A947GJD6_9CYAN|nr:DUF928 domain-containing protein [Leptothoe spongobia]MBT9315868.1 DUF928 domain-containing protein [Leptothoe spongobia TAU-MAC 1115]
MKCIYVSTYLSLSITMGWGISSPSQAQIPSADIIQLAGRPSNVGHPREGTRRGGGSRGGVCDLPANVPSLTALMPDTSTWVEDVTDEATEVVFSFTNRAMPDVWFYLPYSLVASSRVAFTLKDTSGDTLRRTQLDTTGEMPTRPSIIRVSLAELDLSLSPATDYHWYLTVYCESGPPISVDGWINYQPDNSLEQSRGQFLVDTLSVLADHQFSSPDNDVTQPAWRELLESIGLEDITDAPLVNCCSFVE